MTDFDANAEIAGACPNIFTRVVGHDSWNYRNSTVGRILPCINGNICADLNAMHEAEKTLTEYELQGKYPRELAALVVNCGWLPESATSILRLCHATARQRAEAFLRTIGKWKE